MAVNNVAKWCCSSGGTVLRVAGLGESAAVADMVLGISLMISVPSSLGRHHKMRGEY